MFFGSSQNTTPLSEFKFLRVVHIDLDYGTVDLTGLCKLYELRAPSDITHLPRLMFLKAWTRPPDRIGNMKSLRHLFGFDFALYKLDNIKGLELPALTRLNVDTGKAAHKRSEESDLKSVADMLPSQLLVKVSYEDVWNFGFRDD
ncbi:Disease resistance protein RPM1 [Hordeum vulgare]|nr:Disease resistance protein RPM1 [Hordeum vulgare]